jgi:hypothetical protein
LKGTGFGGLPVPTKGTMNDLSMPYCSAPAGFVVTIKALQLSGQQWPRIRDGGMGWQQRAEATIWAVFPITGSPRSASSGCCDLRQFVPAGAVRRAALRPARCRYD